MEAAPLGVLFACRVFNGITSEQEHRGITVQQGGVKVRKLTTLLKNKRGSNNDAVKC